MLKSNINMHWGISEMPSNIKNGLPRVKWSAHEPLLLPDLSVLVCFPTWANLSVVRSCSLVTCSPLSKSPTGQFCHQLHVIGSMYVWYISNELKVCSPQEYLWLFFFGSVILEHSSSRNVLNFFRVQHKGGFDYLMKNKN